MTLFEVPIYNYDYLKTSSAFVDIFSHLLICAYSICFDFTYLYTVTFEHVRSLHTDSLGHYTPSGGFLGAASTARPS